MTLKTYHKKRDFKKTPEPKGKISSKKAKQHLFIIQKHAASHLHYDFRLELNGVLISWAVPKGPCLDPTVKRLAMHVEDHPLEYGNFEGIIPKGQYGGGTVMLWDKGEWISTDDNPTKAYAKGDMSFILHAEKLKGEWKLIRINKNDKTWLLIKIKDEYAMPVKKYDITIEKPDSVISHQSINEIADQYENIWSKQGLKKREKSPRAKSQPKKKVLNLANLDLKPSSFPKNLFPQLATLVDHPPQGDEWVHEIKWDGYRILAFKKGHQTTLFTRQNNDWTDKFQNVADAISTLPVTNVILDGEVVVLDKKERPDFQLLQNSIKSQHGYAFTYYIFDLLYYDKYNLIEEPLAKRKQLLENLLASDKGNVLRYSDHITGSGQTVFDNACKLGLEGIVSKQANSIYLQKRGTNWLKVKCIQRQEFIIGGFTPPKGNRQFFGSLYIGTMNKDNEFIYNGNVGTGFTETSLKEIHHLLLKYKTSTLPFKTKPPGSKNATWVKPVIVAEIEFTEWTKDNILRHPSFKGIRKDKSPKSITKEKAMPIKQLVSKKNKMSSTYTSTLKLSHPQKILYKEDKITKLMIAQYYESVQDWILPYVVNRPLTLVRCPVKYQECFYQKHINQTTPPALLGVMVKEKEKKQKYIYIKDYEGLIALPQMGVLEIHPWGSSIEDIEHPDMIIFDLDPAPEVPWKKVVTAAKELKTLFANIKLRSFVKTTGGKGLHVVIPIQPHYDWEEIKNFSHAMVKYMAAEKPKDYITKMSKAERKGKIFIDYLRNARGATAVAPYSTRARIHAPVATPIEWEELTSNIRDTSYTIQTLPQRLKTLKKDPWHDYFKLKQSLKL